MRGVVCRLVAVAAVVAAALGVAACGAGAAGSGPVSAVAADGVTGSVGSRSRVTPTSPVTSTSAGRSYPGTICRGANQGSPDPAQPDGRSRLATDFAAVAVVNCSMEREQVTGQGEWSVMVEKRATAGLNHLLTAMRQPDGPRTTGPCLAYGQLDPEVWFLDAAGHAVLPRWPRDSCSHLLTDSTTALTSLAWTTTARVRIAQTVPQAAIDAGCSTAFKYEVALTADRGGAAKPGSFAGLARATPAQLCRYRRAGDDPINGEFDSGRRLSEPEWAALRQALEPSPAVQPCTQAATRFAVLTAGPIVEIELDGCHRVLTPDNGLRQATPSLLALLS